MGPRVLRLLDERGGPRTPVPRALLTAVALLVAGGAVGGAVVYAFAERDDEEAAAPARPRVQMLRDGDVVVRREASARCEASTEGGLRNLYCTRLGGGRFSLAFYDDTVLVYGPLGEPTEPDLSLAWKPERPLKACGSIVLGGRRVRVDIVDGDPRVPCASARTVMRRLAATASDDVRGRDIRQEGRIWSCYRSRPDGVGWEFHCIGQHPTGRFVDVGAARRF